MTTSTARSAALIPAVVVGALLLAACGSVTAGGSGGSGGDLPVLRIGTRAVAAGGGPAAPDDPYPLVGTLPTGPASAPVHRFGTAAVPAADVTRLAVALGLSGSVARHAHGAVVVSPDGELRVRDGGTWSFSRHDELCPGQQVDVDFADLLGATATCAVGPDSAATRGKAPTDPRATAAPVLDVAGVGSTTATVQAYADEATVSVEPVVGGAATVGLTTAVVVDAQGVRSAYGVLGEPSEGPAYPLISATQGLDQLRAAPRPEIAISCPVGSTCPGVGPQRITGASLGLMVAWDGGEQVLVPAWFYAVDGSTQPLTVIAVADRYLADPVPVATGGGSGSSGGSSGSAVPPGEPGGPPTASDLPLPIGSPTPYQVTSYSVSADGSTLTLRTEGGVCTDYSGAAVETRQSVTVSITGAWNKASDVACPAIAKVVEVTVALRTPLADRTVVDERTGRAVPRA
jgi:hypothetical protein